MNTFLKKVMLTLAALFLAVASGSAQVLSPVYTFNTNDSRIFTFSARLTAIRRPTPMGILLGLIRLRNWCCPATGYMEQQNEAVFTLLE